MSVYKTKFYGEYKFSDNATPYLLTYLSKFFRTIHIERDVEKIKESYFHVFFFMIYGISTLFYCTKDILSSYYL